MFLYMPDICTAGCTTENVTKYVTVFVFLVAKFTILAPISFLTKKKLTCPILLTLHAIQTSEETCMSLYSRQNLLIFLTSAPSEHVFTTPPTTHPISQFHTLPASSLSHPLPGDIHTCTRVPSAISVPSVLAVELSVPHSFFLMGRNHEYNLLFSQSFFFPDLIWVRNKICIFPLLFVQSHHKQ